MTEKPEQKPADSSTPLSFSSGMKALDDVFQGIMPGDNVVWQTDDFDSYRYFVEPFCRNAVAEGKDLIYFRFADHDPVIPEDVPAFRYELEPQVGFELFISKIFDIMESHGRGGCYVFDCLSSLAVDWNSDRMLGNFFLLTCPYLYRLETVAYFVLFRNYHSPWAIDYIHATSQVVVDVYNSESKIYFQPIKVSARFSPTLYMLHSTDGDRFNPEKHSSVISRIMGDVEQPWMNFNIDNPGIWTNEFIKAYKMFDRIQETGETPSYAEELRIRLIKMIITRDETQFKLCDKYFDLGQLLSIAKRMIGTGLIGGKSVGMLVARAILEKADPKWGNLLETHDSFYIGSDVFYTFIIQNDCWWLRRELTAHGGEPDYDKAKAIREKILQGNFPEDIEERFQKMLNYYGQSPIIVRSSSLLEDAYGNAFSGKYDSVFLANQGTPKQRLEELMNAVRFIYASTMSHEALAYRYHKGLMDKDEQMALLVQRVSGNFYGDFYFPQIAGVGYSFNPFVWNRKIDPSTGVLRMVFGLGTRAVNQHGGDYTRIVALNAPMLRPESNFDEVRKHTQKIIDVLDLIKNRQASLQFEQVVREAAGDMDIEVFASKDSKLEARAKAHGIKNFFPWVLTFEKLLEKTGFVKAMKEILKLIGEAYQHPVDIEFTANFMENDEFLINVVQCRPFHFAGRFRQIKDPEHVKPENLVLKTSGPILGQSLAGPIDWVIYVCPETYGNMGMSQRSQLARMIGDLCNSGKNLKNIMLIGPGRWGTTMPALGIPATFNEIRNASVICEIAAMHEGLNPDISLGTHFFNDLVEMEILYLAMDPDKEDDLINTAVLNEAPNRLKEIVPRSDTWQDAIKLINTRDLKPEYTGYIHVDTLKQKGLLFLAN